MPYKITLLGGFRTRTGARMTRLWHPGAYAVPKHMPEAVAAEALRAGVGIRSEIDPPTPEPMPDPVAEPEHDRSEEIPGAPVPEMEVAGEAEFLRVQGQSAEVAAAATEDSDKDEDEDEEDEDKPKRAPRRRRARKRAPANKSLGRAPANKADAGEG